MERPHGDAGPHRIHHHKAMGGNVMSYAGWYYMGHAIMENRHGLVVAGMVTHANGTAERRASEIMLKARSKAAGRRITAGEDKAYYTVSG
jgi:hypothetical protein